MRRNRTAATPPLCKDACRIQIDRETRAQVQADPKITKLKPKPTRTPTSSSQTNKNTKQKNSNN